MIFLTCFSLRQSRQSRRRLYILRSFAGLSAAFSSCVCDSYVAYILSSSTDSTGVRATSPSSAWRLKHQMARDGVAVLSGRPMAHHHLDRLLDMYAQSRPSCSHHSPHRQRQLIHERTHWRISVSILWYGRTPEVFSRHLDTHLPLQERLLRSSSRQRDWTGPTRGLAA